MVWVKREQKEKNTCNRMEEDEGKRENGQRAANYQTR